MQTLGIWIFPCLPPGSPQKGLNTLGTILPQQLGFNCEETPTVAIICPKREPSQEPRPKTGIRVEMKVTVERKIQETEDRSESLPSGKASGYSPPEKEALLPTLPPILISHPNSLSSGPLAKKRWQETGMEQGQNLIKTLGSNPDSVTVRP